ncbi:hypothetical protein EYZ11_000797 [Aspergillus tanneri]|uniref:Xaa-Pro dipeptidyl-peptidase-like domain-containing protein n=1 Tax=Aspergillus tanneri TaxID=1220188 RepID=A0A4S3JWE7_9EURO|nr:hypothetical protein EYZ11_000797 [Aspergillus tanneri]
MDLPSPTYAFTIPSVYDEIQLDCRLYLPRELSETEYTFSGPIRGAIVAHPYATLGGCYDDPVVGFVGGELLEAGYVVGTFNFRGAGGSEGSTSWTARPELADYVSFYGFMLFYLHGLRLQVASQGGRENMTDAIRQMSSEENSEDARTNVHLVLGGYSYGSMITSHLPAIGIIADLFENSSDGSAPHEISRAAEKALVLSTNIKKVQEKLPPIGDFSDRKGTLHVSRTKISYLLVSPLLPPINLFLTFFSKLSLEVGTHTSAEGKHVPCPSPTDQLSANPTMAIYGNQDAFTSAINSGRSRLTGLATFGGKLVRRLKQETY